MQRGGCIYILTNKNRTVLYIGVTSSLEERLYEHKSKAYKGFTSKYNCDTLIYFEYFDSITEAIKREKQLKKYNRDWKIELIQKVNPEFRDLSDEIKEQ